jgi:hypothetical protein
VIARLISLAEAHIELGWPKPEEIIRPSGVGAGVFAALARDKIGRALAHFEDARDAVIGVLTTDPGTARTEPPLSVVVEFQRQVSDLTLRELHRLAWNFSHCPAVITVEPGLLRVWSCCEAPNPERRLTDYVVHELEPPNLLEARAQTLERRAARALHWINLVSGEFFREHADRFDRNGRADQMLLRNLRHIRTELAEAGLRDDDICHDLLARIIFVQFLFDRKDSEGYAALTPAKLARLHADGILRRAHGSFASILGDFEDTYRLFDWLNARFNGDLFPGKGDTPAARARGWAAEKRGVTKRHLALLADFIRGDIEMPSGQGCLWPQYAFDVIPLEFISSIYETFVTERASEEGIFYTPPHLVDFVLDRVLPWDGELWDVTVLDPACGSGIFLVKAFQRLIHRWKRTHPDQQIRTDTLRRLLEHNLFGVDKDPHAVRVACFSLYLAMCDEIDPRHYWTHVVFPPMRDRRLVCADFFEERHTGFRTGVDSGTYDLVIGNAPWGEKLLTDAAQLWARQNEGGWPLANKGIGTLFLPKAARLLKAGGRVAIIQSASSLLFNRQSRAAAFRRQLFYTYRVEEIINLSALRFTVFKRKTHATRTSVSPACIVILNAAPPGPDDRIVYVSPKQLEQLIDEFQIVIEPQDRRWLTAREAASDASVWTALMWGGNRDRTLLARLRKYPSLAAPGPGYEVQHREGIIIGNEGRARPQLRNRRMLKGKSFPDDVSLLYLDGNALPKLNEIRTHSRDSTNFAAFASPQLIIKQGWQKEISRFQARLTRSTRGDGVLCTQSYVSVHTPASQLALLEAACLSLNSSLATYYLMLTSGRFATYRPEPLVEEMLAVPIPLPRSGLLVDLASEADIDARVFEAFGIKDAERVLIEDLFNYTLPDFRGDRRSSGRQRTARQEGNANEPQLIAYCRYFTRVLKAGFGRDKAITATIFQEEDRDAPLPYRLVAFELGRATDREVGVTRIKLPELLNEFDRLDRHQQKGRPGHSGIYHQRVARVYESLNGTPTVFVIKPDMRRHWTRSAGLSDADDVSLDLFRWQQAGASPEIAYA